jgi:hypothetical protein
MNCPMFDGGRRPCETIGTDAMGISRRHRKRAHPTRLYGGVLRSHRTVRAQSVSAEARSFEIGVRGFDAGPRSLEVGARSLEVGARSLDAGAWSLDAGARSSDAGPRSTKIEALNSNAGPRSIKFAARKPRYLPPSRRAVDLDPALPPHSRSSERQSQRHLTQIATALDTRPKKCLAFLMPEELVSPQVIWFNSRVALQT